MLLFARWSSPVVIAGLLVLMLGPFQGLESATGLNDKLMHAGAFAVVTAGMFLNLRSMTRVQIAGLAFLLGIGVEIIQGMTGRDMDVLDALADLAGILIVTVAWPARKIL
jgi:VanZ family protein